MRRVIALLVFAFLWGCTPESSQQQNAGNWKNVGSIHNGHYTADVWWTTNENGDRVYVMMGASRGGIFVVPGPVKSEGK